MDYFECYCGNYINLANGVEHLMECQVWIKKSDLFKAAKKMVKSPDSYYLMRLECEALMQYQFVIDDNPKFKQSSEMDDETRILIQQWQIEEQRPPHEEGIRCSACQQEWPDMSQLQFLSCEHIVCTDHLKHEIYSKYSRSERSTCPARGCSYGLSMDEILQVVPQDELNRLEPSLDSILKTQGGMRAQCPCGNVSWLEPGKPDYSYKDENGKILSKTHSDHMASFRFRCPCAKVTCAGCGTEPYHTGRTCEEFKLFKEAKHCRYCSKSIKSSANHCKDEDCKKRFRSSCKKVLPCSHLCFGTNEELDCSECLDESCGGKGNEMCTICYIEGLASAPCVFLSCSHIYHYHCLFETLQKRWPGPRITFKFARCASCNAWIEARFNPSIQNEMGHIYILYEDIKDKALKRLKFEGNEQHPKLTQRDSQYFNNPEKYALDTFSYYQCFNCKKSYFGGKRDCEQNNEAAKYDPKDLVCPSCSAIGKEGADCPKHGKDYIEFKCKFCCGIAAWFCWGTTHFCDSCHTRQNNGDYLSKKNRAELPVCPGPAACPLKVQHPANGEEFALGCSLCRNMIANNKEF